MERNLTNMKDATDATSIITQAVKRARDARAVIDGIIRTGKVRKKNESCSARTQGR